MLSLDWGRLMSGVDCAAYALRLLYHVFHVSVSRLYLHSPAPAPRVQRSTPKKGHPEPSRTPPLHLQTWGGGVKGRPSTDSPSHRCPTKETYT